MKFRIYLTRMGDSQQIPINYQYELSSGIYRTIDRADSAFSRFLHDYGYIQHGKRFRLFVFSRLNLDRYQVDPHTGCITHRGSQAYFDISFLVDLAAETFVRGLFEDQTFVVADQRFRAMYQVSRIEACGRPQFQQHMHYRCQSPVFIRRKRPDGGEDYLHPLDRDYGILLVQNLLAKTNAFHQGEECSDVLTIPDFDFKVVGKIYKNGVLIKQGTEKESKLIGYSYEFALTAPAELQEIGYYAGFGHLGSQGFGCVDVINGFYRGFD